MKKESPLWHSVGILAGVVILIVAFTRGWLMTSLLLIAACTWGAWLFSTQRPLGSKRKPTRRPRAADAAPTPTEAQDAAAINTLLLLHVNRRITEMLHAPFPSATWKWCVKNPLRLILKGGVGRIRVFGVEGFEYADIAIETTGNVSCNMLRMVPLSAAQVSDLQDFSQTVTPLEQLNDGPDPKIWYEESGRKTLEQVVNDLNSRGYHSLTINADGSIHISGEEPQDGAAPSASLAGFPPAKKWSELVALFAEDGLNATLNQDALELSW